MVNNRNPAPSTRTIIIVVLVVLVALPATLCAAGAIIYSINVQARQPEQTVVPQLVGLDIETARTKAAEANLAPPLTFLSWDRPERPGTVVSQDPPPGRTVQTSSPLALYVSVDDTAAALDDIHNPKVKKR